MASATKSVERSNILRYGLPKDYLSEGKKPQGYEVKKRKVMEISYRSQMYGLASGGDQCFDILVDK